jgi:chromosomal replication initiator protein
MVMDLNILWDSLLTAMADRIGKQDVEIWLKNATPVHLGDGGLLLDVPNRYYADWIADNYVDALSTELKQILGSEVALQFTFTWRDEPADEPVRGAPVRNGSLIDDSRVSGVNPAQTFATFVIGECNKFAHAAAAAVADNPARNYNPLFIYGATGLGKTHLMHAIGNQILASQPSATVVYVTAEDFMNEMVNYLRYKQMDEFRSKYRRRASVLLVDDVQFLSGKERTQEEFFHTFNALHSVGRQIVLSSDAMPKDIGKLERRLQTRFEMGLLADMQAPDRETLLAILHQKADGLRMKIPTDLADAIANLVAGNIRELEGIVNRLGALHALLSEPLTLEWARAKLPGVFDPPVPTVTVAAIIEAVAKFHNLRSADITGTKKTRTLSRARHIAMYLARVHTNLSFPELGREFGGRDHSTIQHGYRKLKDEEVESDADLAYRIKLIEQGLHLRP